MIDPLRVPLPVYLRARRGRYRSWQRRERETMWWTEAVVGRRTSAAHNSYREFGMLDPMMCPENQ